MPSSKDIRRRIKSINSTKKITRAVEMISAAKMRRAVASVLGIRPYAHSAWSVLTNLATAFENYGGGFLEVREAKNILIVAVSSDRGQCGSFNTQIAKKLRDEILNPEKLKINRIGKKKIESSVANEDLKIDFITVGKKGEGIVRKLKKEIIATFPELTPGINIESIKPLSRIVIEEYLAKRYDKVVVVYTDYVSAVSQQTRIRQILPISKIDIEKQIAEIDVLAKEYGLDEPKADYKVEPSPKEVLEFIFPRLIEMQLFHAILESSASEQSARMIAMRNATDAANEMSADLTLAYNQIRQSKITQEIAEISAGRAALE
ncbi:MAG: ATP synthase gamma chain [Parcubacteria group bacterium GW2011_GWE2_39_37]|uniref:ATP synthase gamma chain n=1 Tax=Candidatus Falkowbacteria bacterium GW2011_GWF2_39_8 TaxID=1618642 RepID=A0A0G0PX84_9BACT|nr:MAG: ATP synthase gamma chain [Parcubacteria group bacterium GW2011_GWE2_39_37]KKR32744.1 MAG: ATP synthase gamma chain [Candidatus Falkowbacteria bacterium GW2011_GWF2_39_8]